VEWKGHRPIRPELEGEAETLACRWGKTCDMGTVPRSELEGEAETLACRWGQTWWVQKFQKIKRKKKRENEWESRVISTQRKEEEEEKIMNVKVRWLNEKRVFATQRKKEEEEKRMNVKVVIKYYLSVLRKSAIYWRVPS
jgi:hypothetical protein